MPIYSAAESTLSDEDESESSDDSEPEGHHFSFPELDAAIRSAIVKYHAVFPKLNFSSPKDAAWVLPMSSPLKCTSPADVYLLLKSSDFIACDLSVEHVFDGCDIDDRPPYDLELVLRKWHHVDRSREVRCFVRNDNLLGITQRDMNFYDYMIDPVTQIKIKSTVCRLWEENIRPNWTVIQPDCTHIGLLNSQTEQAQAWQLTVTHVDVFDLLLTRDLSSGHVLDFNPYVPRTDPLLFSYEELHALFVWTTRESDRATDTIDLPQFRVVDSPVHPVVVRNAPTYQHNMIPIEALSLSEGKSIAEFSEIWRDEIKLAVQDDDKDNAHDSSKH